jgi:hypothetical protein
LARTRTFDELGGVVIRDEVQLDTMLKKRLQAREHKAEAAGRTDRLGHDLVRIAVSSRALPLENQKREVIAGLTNASKT